MIGIQLRLPSVRAEGSFGITAGNTQVGLQMEVYKELVNKLAWALGTVYGRSYSNKTTVARKLALQCASMVVSEVGWPDKIERKT